MIRSLRPGPIAGLLLVASTSLGATPPVYWRESEPPARVQACAVYDSTADRMFLFSGTVGRDVWPQYRLPAWDLALPSGAWTQHEFPSPAAATMNSCAWDPLRRAYWMFSSYDLHALRVDLGSGDTWREVPFEGAQPFEWLQVAFDPRQDRFFVLTRPPWPKSSDTLALYSAQLADTLRFSRIAIDGPQLTGYYFSAVVWNRARATFDLMATTAVTGGPLVLFSLRTDAPRWESLLIQPDPISGSPADLFNLLMAEDPTTEDLYLFGTSWAGSGTPLVHQGWRLIRGPTTTWMRIVAPPDSASGGALIADSRRRRLILHGGSDSEGTPLSTTRAFDIENGAWDFLVRPTAPEPRSSYAMAYDHARDRMLMFGGLSRSSALLGDLWARDSHDGSWSDVEPEGPSPPPRDDAYLLEDERHARFLLVGGRQESPAAPEIWQLTMDNLPAWSPIPTSGTPPDRVDGVLLDEVRDRLIIHGAISQPFQVGEWELPLKEPATWRRLAVVGAANPPQRCGFTFDRARDRALLFGGYSDPYDGTIANDELWGFSLASDTVKWERLSDPNATIRRRLSAYINPGGIVVDPVRDRLLSFGGYGADFFGWVTSDLATSISLSGSLGWTDYAQQFGGPPPTTGRTLVYDPIRDSFVLYGVGNYTSTASTFEWEGRFEGWPAVRARVTSAFVPTVRLEWSAPAGPAEVVVKRRGEDGVWRAIGKAERAADGMLHFTDRKAIAGRNESYRLLWPVANGEIPVGQVTFTTELPTESAVRIRDNPAHGSIAMDLDLPVTGSVRVELLDLSGRRIRERRIESRGSGRLPFEFTDLAGISPGLYFVRVTSPAGVRDARVTLLR